MNNENIGEILSRHFRPIMITVGIIVVLCIVAIFAVIISNIKPEKTYISVNIAPTFATVNIDGQEYRSGTYEISPGNYSVTISADGFEPKTINLEVISGKTTPVSAYLLNKKEGLSYFERNAADISVLETLSDPELEDFLTAYHKKISIRDYFPIDATYDMSAINGTPGNDLYAQTITDGTNDPDCSYAFCLYASGYRLNEDALREALSDLGYNFDDYEVIYDYEN